MKASDLKTVIELMEITSKDFPCVRIENSVAYATNGQALVCRKVSDSDNSTFSKSDISILKAILSKNKGDKIEDSLSEYNDSEGSNFPPFDVIDKALNQEFAFTININADNLIKSLKALKGKDNKVTIRIVDDKKPFMVSHVNGNCLIAPIV